MKHKREFDTSYFHNSHVQGVNYSLFIMLLKEMPEDMVVGEINSVAKTGGSPPHT
jgi:hypothetical protein